jgi:catechol 2,3-dioxygenase-like lactoylglutathione lyase family enzyme
VFAHVGLEVSDLARSAAFYDAVFHRLGCRRIHDSDLAIAYGRVNASFWIVARGLRPAPGYGHIALEAAGKAAVDAAYESGIAAGGTDAGPPGPRPQYGPSYYAAYLYDPDGLKLEVVSGAS